MMLPFWLKCVSWRLGHCSFISTHTRLQLYYYYHSVRPCTQWQIPISTSAASHYHSFALPVLDSSRISVTCYNKHARRKTRVNPGGELLTVVAVPVTNNHTTIYLTSQLSCRIPCAARASPTPQLVGPWYTSQILRGLPEV